MALFSFYNVRKPRQFDHKPIYWDPHKEAMEDRIRKVKREIGMEEELSIDDYKAEIKGSFVEGTSHLTMSRDNGHDSRSRTYCLVSSRHYFCSSCLMAVSYHHTFFQYQFVSFHLHIQRGRFYHPSLLLIPDILEQQRFPFL